MESSERELFLSGALVRPSSHFFPKGRPGMFDVTPLSGISELSFDSPFLFPFLFFDLFSFSLVLLLFLPCHFLLMVHSSDFFQKILKQFSLRVRGFLWVLLLFLHGCF